MELQDKIMSDVVAFRTYAKYLPHLNRREIYPETVNRAMNMHLDKFPHLSKDITFAFNHVHDYHVAPSMRSLQWAGEPLLKNEIRGYNCSGVNCDDVAVFGEAFFLLLSGTGVGFSVQSHHINQLPVIRKPMEEGTYIINDSIMGWAESVDTLIKSYTRGSIRPIFDYSLIRPKGSIVGNGTSKAPGPQPLKKSLELVEKVLNGAIGRKLKSIECADLLCYISEAVMSGGQRRSASIILFDRFDSEMLKYKSGQWWEKNAQRSLANVSAILPYSETTYEEFCSVYDVCRNSGSGEPGMSWTNNIDLTFNPCLSLNSHVLTKDGIKKLKDINIGDTIWSGKEWTIVTNKWKTGTKEVYKYSTNAGYFLGTSNHRIVQNGEKIEIDNAEMIDIATGEVLTEPFKHDIYDIMDGLVIGDGTKHKASNNLMLLMIGDKDFDYFDSEIKELIGVQRDGIGDRVYEIQTTIKSEELNKTYNRVIPDRFFYGDYQKKCSFLRGLFSANGTVVSNRISLKGSSYTLIKQVQIMLSSIGISSYITTNKSKEVEFNNGTYVCKESYDLNISSDRIVFFDQIGFLQKYKNEKIRKVSGTKKQSFEIISKEFIAVEDVYDITVDCESHVFWCDGHLVSNCHEINLRSQTFCNLSSINANGITNKKEFFRRVKAATIIGTLQASYTNFPFLRSTWKERTEEDALIGVSITGIADNPAFFTPDILTEGAKLVIETNQKFAKKIGINPAKRTTCNKPDGTTSVILGTASGAHDRHDPYYIRRVRTTSNDPLVAYFKRYLPDFVEDSFMRDDEKILVFPQKSPKGSVTRTESSATDLFNRIILFNKYWIHPGHVSGDNHNNVSATISVKDHEWDELRELMWQHRYDYHGISLLPYDGGTYQQAPFETITEDQYNEMVVKLKPIDLRFVSEETDNTSREMSVACSSGGVCELNL